jgi:SAM-dependent methyltransferase
LSAGSRFDRTADRYAAHAAGRDWAGFLAWCECRPSDRVLDVAGGPGVLAGALREMVASVTVLDASPRLLEHVPDGVERIIGRAEQLPFAAAAFDLVTCVNSLHHIARPARALDEMARVLAPGGRLVLEDMVADPDPRRARRWEEIERLRDPEHGRLIAPGDPRAPLQAAGMHLDAEETWLRTSAVEPWLEVAGCTGPAAARVRGMIGASEFEVRVWRARYRKPSSASGV